VNCPWWAAILGFLMVVVGAMGNAIAHLAVVAYFVMYFSLVLLIAFVMLNRASILKLLLYALESTFPDCDRFGWLMRTIKEAKRYPNVFFAKYPDLCTINKAILYVRENEQTADLTVVHYSSLTADHEKVRCFQVQAPVRSLAERIISSFCLLILHVAPRPPGSGESPMLPGSN
jgi:hypothetical protein